MLSVQAVHNKPPERYSSADRIDPSSLSVRPGAERLARKPRRGVVPPRGTILARVQDRNQRLRRMYRVWQDHIQGGGVVTRFVERTAGSPIRAVIG
jgi:hypothetical protein